MRVLSGHMIGDISVIFKAPIYDMAYSPLRWNHLKENYLVLSETFWQMYNYVPPPINRIQECKKCESSLYRHEFDHQTTKQLPNQDKNQKVSKE